MAEFTPRATPLRAVKISAFTSSTRPAGGAGWECLAIFGTRFMHWLGSSHLNTSYRSDLVRMDFSSVPVVRQKTSEGVVGIRQFGRPG